MRKITCNCGHEIETDFQEEYDLDTDPGKIQEILDGSFMSVRCDSCDTLLKPELPCRLVSSSLGLDIHFLPEQLREDILTRPGEYPQTGRIAIGYRELVEKVAIYQSRMNDRVIEIIKYFYLQKAGSGKNVTVFFDKKDSETLYFQIHGLKENEIAVAKISIDFYNKISGDLPSLEKQDDYKAFITPPYVSINRIYLGEE